MHHAGTLASAGRVREGTQANLQCAVAVQEIDEISFVRLEPVELRGGNRAEVEAVDVRGVCRGVAEGFVVA